jgi:hypothetical protein
LALRSFKRLPTIVIFGAGHSGSVLIDYLVECKLGPCLRIFARGDFATKHWSGKNLQSSSSLADLLGHNKADIVVMCSGMSSFGSISRFLIPFVSRATFFISSCFGLSRKRIYNSIRTTNIFRTFQEPLDAFTRFGVEEKSVLPDSGLDDKNNKFSDIVANVMESRREYSQKKKTIALNSFSIEEQSADYIVKRCPNLRNMIFLLENYYAIRGMTHLNARKESIGSLLGRNTDEAVDEEMPSQVSNKIKISIKSKTIFLQKT